MAQSQSVDLATRSELADRGWLGDIQAVLDAPVKPPVLSCPECGSDELLTWDDVRAMRLNIKCASCGHHDEIPEKGLIL